MLWKCIGKGKKWGFGVSWTRSWLWILQAMVGFQSLCDRKNGSDIVFIYMVMCNVCRVSCEYQEEIWDDLSEGCMELVEVWDDCGLNSALGSSVRHVSIELDLALKETWAEQFSIDIPGSTLGY